MKTKNCDSVLSGSCIYSPTNNNNVTYDVEEYINVRRVTVTSNVDPTHKQCTWQTGSSYSSTCPHHYVINYDPNRQPKRILEAKCNCNENMRCLNGRRGSRCVPVKYYINVIRKSGCERPGNVFTYSHVVEAITVGCTCAYPYVVSSERNVSED